MASASAEASRGERVLPGIWRLRMPLPWPGVPHVNAWALSAGDGIVLVDTGIYEEGALAELERALAQRGRRRGMVEMGVRQHDPCDPAPLLGRAGHPVDVGRFGGTGVDHPGRAPDQPRVGPRQGEGAGVRRAHQRDAVGELLCDRRHGGSDSGSISSMP